MVDFGIGFQRRIDLPFREVFRIIWPHSFGAIPFIGAFIYLLAVVFPQRPTSPDPVRGFIHQMGVEGASNVYVSALDLTLMFGAWGIAALIIVSGVWRVFRAARKAKGPLQP